MPIDFKIKDPYNEFEVISKLVKKIFKEKEIFIMHPLFIEIYEKGSKVLDNPCVMISFENLKIDPLDFGNYIKGSKRELIVYDKNVLYESTKFFQEYKSLLNKNDLTFNWISLNKINLNI